MASQYRPGWYQHPEGDTRWWDGEAWHKPDPPASVGASPTKSDSKTIWWFVGGLTAFALVVACCCGGAYFLVRGSSDEPQGTESYEPSEAYLDGYEYGEDAWQHDLSMGIKAYCSVRAWESGYGEEGPDRDDFMEGCKDGHGSE
ncbi:hypothetical protein [Janibacter indicus]|uniref:hypothetical protein n=1 Tax=Janibacter indicus TaxID=857417 RepID=UPI003EBE86E2